MKYSAATEITFSAMAVFANDGKLDEQELEGLLQLAMRDGEIDDDEKRVLNNIFKRVLDGDPLPAVRERIKQIKQKHGV